VVDKAATMLIATTAKAKTSHTFTLFFIAYTSNSILQIAWPCHRTIRTQVL
jgi:hypothetical protein